VLHTSVVQSPSSLTAPAHTHLAGAGAAEKSLQITRGEVARPSTGTSPAGGSPFPLAGGELLEVVLEGEGVEDRLDGGLVVLGEPVDARELFKQIAVGDLATGLVSGRSSKAR
jgi:hypothetical protein